MTVFALKAKYVRCDQARIATGRYPDEKAGIGWHVLGDCGGGYEEHIGTPTVSLAEYGAFAPPGHTFIKVTPEYEGYLESLVEAGIVADTGVRMPAGYVAEYAAVCRVLIPELVAEFVEGDPS